VVVTIAYVSHILADMLTVSGLAVLWPYKKDDYRLLPKRLCIVTNTWPEHMAALILFVLIGVQLGSILRPLWSVH
jgi:membrane-bound metal-dependent hydrolase YbcI (DUF457 family)